MLWVCDHSIIFWLFLKSLIGKMETVKWTANVTQRVFQSVHNRPAEHAIMYSKHFLQANIQFNIQRIKFPILNEWNIFVVSMDVFKQEHSYFTTILHSYFHSRRVESGATRHGCKCLEIFCLWMNEFFQFELAGGESQVFDLCGLVIKVTEYLVY